MDKSVNWQQDWPCCPREDETTCEPRKASTHITSPIHTSKHRSVRDAGQWEAPHQRWPSPETGRNWRHSYMQCLPTSLSPQTTISLLPPSSSPHDFLSFSFLTLFLFGPHTQKEEGKKSMWTDSLPLLSEPTKNLENCTLGSSAGASWGCKTRACSSEPLLRHLSGVIRNCSSAHWFF